MFITVRLPSKEIARAIAWVAKAVAKEPSRRILQHVKFSHHDGYLTVVACDGMRLHEARIPNLDMDITVDGMYKVEVVNVTKKLLVLSSAEAILSPFPEYENIFPQPGTEGTEVKLNKKFITDAASFTTAPVIRMHEGHKPATVEGIQDGIIFRGLVMPLMRAPQDR